MSTPERESAADAIFEAPPSGLSRTAGDAASLGVEALDSLGGALASGVELGDADMTAPDQRVVDSVLRPTAINAGKTCLDAMRGLVISEATAPEVMSPRRHSEEFVPINEPWRESGSPYASALSIVRTIRAKIEGKRDQPNQLYRYLAEAVAFSADLAGWSAYVDLSDE